MNTDQSQRTRPISDFMTEEVRASAPGAKLAEVASLLVDAGCHHVPIVDEGRLVGIVSSRDLLHAYRADSEARS